MVAEVFASLSAFKTMFDLAKGLKDINDAAVRNSAVIELQEQILSAQQQQATLIEKVGQLEKEMTGLKTWDAEKQRYELADLGGGTFAYLLKPDMARGEPPHRLCAACYQKDQKSILQSEGQDGYSRDRYLCPACKTEFKFGTKVHRAAAPRDNWIA